MVTAARQNLIDARGSLARLAGPAPAPCSGRHPVGKRRGRGRPSGRRGARGRGIIAALAARHARLRLVALTDGEASHPDERESIGPRRAAETQAAMAALGARHAEVIRLALPDSGLAAHEHDVTARLRELARGFDVCLAPWARDAHPDHEVAGRAAAAACGPKGVLWYPGWMWHWARPGDPRVPWHAAARVPLPRPVVARKRQAISCFASQLGRRGPGLGPVLPPGIVAHFIRDLEVVFPVSRR